MVNRTLIEGQIFYKVSNSLYLYTVVDTGGLFEKAYLLRANEYPNEAAMLS
jgi:hypothetical protein